MNEKFQLDVFETAKFKSTIGICFCEAAIVNAEVERSEHYTQFYVAFSIDKETYDYHYLCYNNLYRQISRESMMADFLMKLTAVIDEIKGR